MIFSEIYRTRIEDYDKKGFLSVEAVLRIFENIGNHHSDSVSNSVIKGSLDGVAWIFSEWRIEFNRLPEYGESVKAETWVSGKVPSSSVIRNFILSDSKGNALVKGTAKFALFDLIKNRPVRISSELFELYSPESYSVFEHKSERLKEPSEYDSELQLFQRRGDVDFNGHVHNINYLIYALEALPQHIYENGIFDQIRISYKSPLKAGELITVKAKEYDDVYSVGIYGEDRLSSIVEIVLK